MRQSAIAWIVVTLAAAPAAAEWKLDGGVVKGGPTCGTEGGECVESEMPCVGTSLAELGDQLYVTCDTGGVLVLDAKTVPATPLEVRRMLEPVPATRVRRVKDKVWVETPLGSRPLDAFDRVAPGVIAPPADVAVPQQVPPAEEAPPADEPPPAEEPPPARIAGKVVEVGRGFVIVDIGRDSGLSEEDWVEFLYVEDVDLGAGQVVQRERRLGVGQVDTLNPGRAKVALALNERVGEGATVRPNPKGVTSLKVRLAPPRPKEVWETEVTARPFLALGTLGGGAIMDGRVTRRFEAPVAVDVLFTPFGFGLAEAGNVLAFAGNVVVSYDTTLFQIGLGGGVARVSESGEDFIAGADASPPGLPLVFSATQYARLGSVDGLNLKVLNNFALVEDEFEFGGIHIGLQVPIARPQVSDALWFIARGGGGLQGHTFAEIGLRLLARGNGGPGSIFLTPTVGGGVLYGETWDDCQSVDYDWENPDRPVPDPEPGICRSTTNYGGPLVGIGVEWRL